MVPTLSGTPRRLKTACAATGSVGARWRPQGEGGAPRQARNEVSHKRDSRGREEYEAHGKQRYGAQARAQVERREGERLRV